MREILFRAHRVDKDQWAYGYYAFQGESHKILLNMHCIRRLCSLGMGACQSSGHGKQGRRKVGRT